MRLGKKCIGGALILKNLAHFEAVHSHLDIRDFFLDCFILSLGTPIGNNCTVNLFNLKRAYNVYLLH